jgi:hypothetical protein
MTLFLQSRFSKIILGRLFIDFGFFTAWLFIKLICVDCDYVWAYFFLFTTDKNNSYFDLFNFKNLLSIFLKKHLRLFGNKIIKIPSPGTAKKKNLLIGIHI